MDDISTNYLRSKLAFSEPSIFEKEIKVVPYSDLDYVMAAELLDTFVGTISKRTNPVKNVTNENRHKVSMLAFETFKYLKYIDLIILKTQFLVNYPELLQNLSLLKVLLYQVLKNQFNYNSGGIVYQHDSEYPQVREFAEAIYAYKVRLAACYARLRIEKQAIGSSPEEVLRNILPKEDRQETQIGDHLSKYFRINTCKVTKEQVLKKLSKLGYNVVDRKVDLDKKNDNNCITFDKDFDDLLVIPPALFNEIGESELIHRGWLAIQEKPSIVGPLEASISVKDDEFPVIIDARAGNGTRASTLAAMIHNKGKIFAVEEKPGRLATLKRRLQLYNIKRNLLDPNDPHFENVSTIICEPPSSGSSIIDKFSYVIQEEELPEGEVDSKDLERLKNKQIETVEHALKFPNVQTIIYVTHSVHFEENEQVVCEILDRNHVELDYVMPQFLNDEVKPFEFKECFKLAPSDYGNGIFVACFRKLYDEPIVEQSGDIFESEINNEQTMEEELIQIEHGQGNRKQKFKAKRILAQRHQFLNNDKNLKKSYIREDIDDILVKGKPIYNQVKFMKGLGIIGHSLSKFYKSNVSNNEIRKRNVWKYPVPNPKPWK